MDNTITRTTRSLILAALMLSFLLVSSTGLLPHMSSAGIAHAGVLVTAVPDHLDLSPPAGGWDSAGGALFNDTPYYKIITSISPLSNPFSLSDLTDCTMGLTVPANGGTCMFHVVCKDPPPGTSKGDLVIAYVSPVDGFSSAVDIKLTCTKNGQCSRSCTFMLTPDPALVAGFAKLSGILGQCARPSEGFSDRMQLTVKEGTLIIQDQAAHGLTSIGRISATGNFEVAGKGASYSGRLKPNGAGTVAATYRTGNCLLTYTMPISPSGGAPLG